MHKYSLVKIHKNGSIYEWFSDRTFNFFSSRDLCQISFDNTIEDLILRYASIAFNYYNHNPFRYMSGDKILIRYDGDDEKANGRMIDMTDYVIEKTTSLWMMKKEILAFLSELNPSDIYNIFKLIDGKKINYIISEEITEEYINMFNIQNFDIYKNKKISLTLIYDLEVDPSIKLVYSNN